jgi:hypothetical protein
MPFSLFGKNKKVAPAPPPSDVVEQKYITAAIQQLVAEGKSQKGPNGEDVVDEMAKMSRAFKLQSEDRKTKTWKGGRTRRRRRGTRSTRGLSPRRTRKNK